ncbi:Uncharacterised protein [Citrobacter koseri]|uniref:Uncharacterized protein n=1 Tax=Citrobacter koseri TaxID=545 RepID=A0A2X2X731_CITKO|nr:Uncharacterised protein [Citrobacter koseri]
MARRGKRGVASTDENDPVPPRRKRSEDILLSGQQVEAIRMTTINARLPETLPALSGARDSYQLVFNTQGKGPYMLAWGNRAAEKADVELDMLIPSVAAQNAGC